MFAAIFKLCSTSALEKSPASFLIPAIRSFHSLRLTWFAGFGSPPIFSGVGGNLPGPALAGREVKEVVEIAGGEDLRTFTSFLFFIYVLLVVGHDVDIERVVGHGTVHDVGILREDDIHEVCRPILVLCPGPGTAFGDLAEHADDFVERDVHLPGRLDVGEWVEVFPIGDVGGEFSERGP